MTSQRLYLVTGGAGFIGSHLTDALLKEGHAVRVIDNLSTGHASNLDPRCDLILGDVTEPGLLAQAMEGAAGCFHLAAIASVTRSNEDWVGTHRANATGTVAVLDTARALGGTPVVYASSAAVYGDQGTRAIREDAALRPRTAYGADKLASELHADVAFRVHGVPTLGFRFFNVYGPRQDPSSPYSGVISIFAARLAAGKSIRINGDGRQIRDFVYVGDVIAHLLAGMEMLEKEPQSAIFNVCTGRATSVLELAEKLGAVSGRLPDVEVQPERPGDIRTSIGDPTAAMASLSVIAKVPLETGLSLVFDERQSPRAEVAA